MLNYRSVVLFVKDINVSKKFYDEIFHFRITHDFGTNIEFKEGISIWQADPRHIISTKLENKVKQDSNRFELYFETDDIIEFSKILKSHGVKELHSIHEENWGQQTIRFFDPDGHLIEVGESLEFFVMRLASQGLSKEEIARKTSISTEWLSDIL